MNNRKIFRQRLATERKARNWSQEALARNTGLQSTAISHFETGARRPSFDNLIKLSKGMGVSIDWLVGLRD